VIAPARRAAYEALHAISGGGQDLPAALAASRDRLPDPRDRALASEIVIGVLRWRSALDHMAEALVRRPLAKLDTEVVDILRLALYQLWHLERVPASAIVNDAVELTRVARRGRASALVNAALRAFGRLDAASLLPAAPDDPDASTGAAVEYLAITLSHPRWLVERWLSRFGFTATESWLRFNNGHAPITLRANTLRTSVENVRSALLRERIVAEPARHAPGALVVRDGNPLTAEGFATGEFLVQDEASQLVAHMADARPGERLLDACAAPGGKTLVLACDAGGAARVVAADARTARIALLRETLRRTGIPAAIVQIDLRDPAPFEPVFDCVLVDAPCSGLGTLRRDPDIKWGRQESDLPALAAAQRQLLSNAADAVRAGGRLIYATCSSEPDENDGVVSAFLAERAEFAAASRAELARLSYWPVLSPLCDELGWFRTLPHRDGLEAFFAAVLVKAKRL
jgi:16S rRNA (cytosine967-C5)-methyltransferase